MSTAVATPVAIAPADAAAAVPVTAAAPSSAMPAASAAAVAAAAAAAASAPAAPQPYASASLYVGDLAVDVTEALLFEIFNAVGPVASVRVCRDAATRRSLGYAYVNFHRLEDAERALDTLNFKNIRNRACRIMWSHRDPSLRRSGLGNIFVNHLAKDIDNKALYDTFSVFGNILSCKVATNGKRESLGYGFVHYETDESALTAIQRVDGKVISNQQVSVQKFVSKKDRPSAQLAKNRFTNVFIKNLQLDISVAKLEEMFKSFGTITSATVNVPADRTDEKARAFGFVNFETPEQAQAAVDAGNQMEINGKKLFAARAQKKEERRQELAEKFENLKLERAKKYAGVNLYVKNLSDEMEDERLTQEFSKYGAISSATVMKDPATNKSRGFGFVCYTTPDDATRAVTEMNGRMVDGKPLYVALAQRKEQRRAQLEAQYAARQKLGGGAAGGVPAGAGLPLGAPGVNMPYNPAAQLANMPFMFPAQAQQLQMQQQRLGFNYPQQLMAAAAAANQHMRWNPAAAAAQQNMMAAGMVAGQPHLRNQLNYQLMPANAAAAAAAAMNLNMNAAAARQMQGMNPNGPRANTPRQNGNGPRGPMNGPVMPQGGPLTNPAVAAAAAAAGRGPLPQQNIRYNDNVRNQQPANANAANAAPRPAQAVAAPVGEALTAAALAAAPEEMRKQMIGERLFPLVRLTEPDLAGKITGMLLEMDNGELLHLLESREALSDKISEALQVLHQHGEEEQ